MLKDKFLDLSVLKAQENICIKKKKELKNKKAKF